MVKLVVDSSVCCGCLSCVINCAQGHDGHAAPDSARIFVELEPFTGLHVITVCQQCAEAECAENCPEEAISRSADGSHMVLDYDVCIACQLCVEVCPHGGMRYNPFAERVITCDLCGGQPRCASSCFTGALWAQSDDAAAPDKLACRYFHRDPDGRGEEAS